MADTPKHFVGGPVGREMTDDEAYQLGLALFAAINAERDAQENTDTSSDTETDTASS